MENETGRSLWTPCEAVVDGEVYPLPKVTGGLSGETTIEDLTVTVPSSSSRNGRRHLSHRKEDYRRTRTGTGAHLRRTIALIECRITGGTILVPRTSLHCMLLSHPALNRHGWRPMNQMSLLTGSHPSSHWLRNSSSTIRLHRSNLRSSRCLFLQFLQIWGICRCRCLTHTLPPSLPRRHSIPTRCYFHPRVLSCRPRSLHKVKCQTSTLRQISHSRRLSFTSFLQLSSRSSLSSQASSSSSRPSILQISSSPISPTYQVYRCLHKCRCRCRWDNSLHHRSSRANSVSASVRRLQGPTRPGKAASAQSLDLYPLQRRNLPQVHPIPIFASSFPATTLSRIHRSIVNRLLARKGRWRLIYLRYSKRSSKAG